MPSFTTTLQKFDEKGEKTGWTYIDIPLDVTESLKPGQKTSFRVKGSLDDYPIALVALLPMGKSGEQEGGFIMPVNATMRRGIRKEAGASIRVSLAFDDSPMPLSADLLACLDDDPAALAFFQTLAKGHQVYFSNWIEEAKTIETKTKRLTQAVMGLSMGLGFGEMIRYFKK
ncbi:YdeI/OmpD-associated family protein [Spirosoma fluviale]|uniref:Bacteriocin-protection, YdeI or OmpD-Associated n=1 Tax=Spirosoma fluviale TaxID=1597977 RepID=A0A286G2V1_9BACT|nr:YdeI/OmpD-associated family protein [Spirosoma fluviale]SOD89314.1 Bacteriocin-protection, YdeI or OmpD-Associated [Spirosoma fluviale]